MEATIMFYIGIIGYILGLYWDNGKENGNYYSILGVILGITENNMETTIMENQMEKNMENDMGTGIIIAP